VSISDRKILQSADWWEVIRPGDAVPNVWLEVTYTRVASVVAATWDYFPGHHDPNYATSQGQETIYLNTMVLSGFMDRVVTDWAGPSAFIARRLFTMRSSVYPGVTLLGSGEILSKGLGEDGMRIAEVAVSLTAGSIQACTGRITFTCDPLDMPHPSTLLGRASC
jgi:acyl dehydratase